jgi:5-hydroxyisourate hydrolase
MNGRLTTHVLDVSSGRPASGVRIQLFREGGLICERTTNADGRCDSPLLEGEALVSAGYELVFFIGDFFRAKGIESPFLDEVPVRFHAKAGEGYHVPLVCSPWSYSTYRGS